MKKMNMGTIGLIALAGFLLAASAAISYAQIPPVSQSINVSLVRQDPYPAVPGEKVTLLFNVENFGSQDASNVKITVVPKYPFSTYGGENETVYLGTVPGLQYGGNAYQAEFNLIVDKNSADEAGEIEVRYTYGDGNWYASSTQNIAVENPATDFDISGNAVSEHIAELILANAGKQDAQSVTLSVNDGGNKKSYDAGNIKAGNSTKVLVSMPTDARKTGSMNLEIRYTDKTNTRRNIAKDVPVSLKPGSDLAVFVQDSSSNSLTLAVANTGSRPLYSVIVSIPRQAAFALSGASENIIGNIDSGDWGLASFNIMSLGATAGGANNTRGARQNAGVGGNAPQGNGLNNNQIAVEVSYTDELGERYTALNEVPVNLGNNSTRMGTSGRTANAQASGGLLLQNNYLLFGAAGIILVVGALWYLKRKREKRTRME